MSISRPSLASRIFSFSPERMMPSTSIGFQPSFRNSSPWDDPSSCPCTNAGRFIRHGHDAWVLPKVNAVGIVDTLKTLRADEGLRSRLSAGALAFGDEHFNWTRNTATLENFYEQIRLSRTEKAHAPAPAIP